MAEEKLQRLFTTINPNQRGNVFGKVDRVVTPNMNHKLLQPYSLDEVKRVLFQMHPSKSPGLDNVSLFFFFQKYWNIVGDDITEVILYVLSSGHLLHKMNCTHI